MYKHAKTANTAATADYSLPAGVTGATFLFCCFVPPLHYGKVSMGGATFRILNFASHFIRVQIFQIDFPLILSASKYFR